MKTRYFLYICSTLFLITGITSTGLAQSSNCTVMENQGGLVTVSCPGEGPKTINMGGSADIYKKGDPITVPMEPNKNRDVRPRVR
jgi:hypothetical protein